MSKYILTDIDIDGYLKVSNYIKTESFMEAERYFHTDGYVHAGTYVYGAQKVYDGLGNVLADKQNSTDTSLETTSKTVVGAINELNSQEWGKISGVYEIKMVEDLKLWAVITAQQLGFTAITTHYVEGDICSIQKGCVYAITPDEINNVEYIFPPVDDTEGLYSVIAIDTRGNDNFDMMIDIGEWGGDFQLNSDCVTIYQLYNNYINGYVTWDTVPIYEEQQQHYMHNPSYAAYGSSIYSGFAKATYLSDGRTVAEVLESLENSSSVDLSNYYTKTDFPINHATTATTYGVGTGTNYGHLRLYSTFYSGSTYGTSSGYAATPSAVYNAYVYSYLPSSNTSINANYPLIFGSYSSTGSSLYCNSGITINSSTKTLTCDNFAGNLTGTATKATQDASGNVITSTYQPITDTSLDTTSKTIVGAINELNGKDYSDASTAETLKTSRTISLGTGVTSTATSFDGSSNITIPVTGISESYLSWGGKNFSGGYSPIDASMIGVLGANRFAYMPASAISIEYSRDGGTTWSNHSITDSNIGILFSNSSGSRFVIGDSTTSNLATSDCLSRVTINTGDANLYTTLNKFMIYCSTNGSQGCYCTIEKATEANPDTYYTVASNVSISGWSGYNIINVDAFTTYGNTTSQYGRVRFTFGCTSHTSTSYAGLSIYCINGFGGVGWSTPSNTAKYGTVYYVSGSQKVYFPNSILPEVSSTCDLGAENLGYLNSYIDTSYTRLLRFCHPSSDTFSSRFAMGYDNENSTYGYSLRLYPRGSTESYQKFIIDGFADGTYVTGPLNTQSILPITNNSYNIGSSSEVYKNIYATNFVGDLTGNADTATILETSRTIQTNLASTSAVSFDGSSNITPGVTGILPITKGGTGNTEGLAAKATSDASGNVITETYETKTTYVTIDTDNQGKATIDNYLYILDEDAVTDFVLYVPSTYIENNYSCIIKFNPSVTNVAVIPTSGTMYWNGTISTSDSYATISIIGNTIKYTGYN